MFVYTVPVKIRPPPVLHTPSLNPARTLYCPLWHCRHAWSYQVWQVSISEESWAQRREGSPSARGGLWREFEEKVCFVTSCFTKINAANHGGWRGRGFNWTHPARTWSYGGYGERTCNHRERVPVLAIRSYGHNARANFSVHRRRLFATHWIWSFFLFEESWDFDSVYSMSYEYTYGDGHPDKSGIVLNAPPYITAARGKR